MWRENTRKRKKTYLQEGDDTNGDGNEECDRVLGYVLAVVPDPDHHHQRSERGHREDNSDVAGKK